mgnify:CR=1 FL=1
MSIINLHQSDKFRSWLNKINEIIDTLNKTVNDVLGKSPTIHSSPNTMYGAGDSTNYGHVMLSDSTNSTSNTTKSVAATPLAVKEAYDKAQSALTLAESNKSTNTNNSELIAQIQTDLANKANTNHAVSETTYGIGSSANYGHVKLTADITSESDANNGIAVAPIALKTVDDKITSLLEVVNEKAPTYHSSDTKIHGLGSDTEYGHVKLSDDVTLNLTSSEGVAATIGSVKTTYDLATKADVEALDALEKLQQKSPINHASEEDVYGLGGPDVYGHVMVTDSVDLEKYALDGVVPSAGALRDTYLKASEAYDLATEIQSGGVGGGSSVTKKLTDENLNTITSNGVYISSDALSELNYPYSNSCISVLEVNVVDSIIKQILYSNDSVYVRDSMDGGSNWNNWILIAKSKSNYQVEIYISAEFGDDSNLGLLPDEPILSVDRLLELINVYSAIASSERDVYNINVCFDAGTYTSVTIVNLPMNVKFTSYYHEREENTGTEVVAIQPYFSRLRIVKSHVSLSGLKIDTLYAQENSTVIVESNNYMSIGSMKAITGSTIYLSSLYPSDEDIKFPIIIHNTDPEDSIFTAINNGRIYDNTDREIRFEEDVTKSYIFDCSYFGEILVPDIRFVVNGDITLNMSQYTLTKYGSLIHPNILVGDTTNNIIEEDTNLQGRLYGDGSDTKYLRADGTWQVIPLPVGNSSTTKYLRDDGTWQTPPDTKYTLPTATSSTLGGVKVGSNISVSSGTISLSKSNVTTALGYTPPQQDTTYSAGTGISISSNKINNTGVTSFNGKTGAVTYSAPVTSVNGKTGAVTINSDGITGDDIFISTSKNVTLPSGGTWAVIMQSTGDNKDQSTCGTYSGGSSISLSNYGGGSFILGIRIAD